jgi:CRP-like cAMP-binding protein
MEANHQKTLQKTFLFQDIGTEEGTKLITCLAPQVKRFAKNEIIFFTGDAIEHLGIILSGTAHACLERVNGDQTIMAELTPGRVFGEVLVSTRSHQSPVTVYAKSEVTTAFIEYQKVYSMCASACAAHRIFLQNMLKVIGDKYFHLFDRINILSEKTLRARIMAYLYGLSDRGDNPVVALPATKTMLADYLLANRSALSRELRRMEHDGLIAVKGRDVELMFLA